MANVTAALSEEGISGVLLAEVRDDLTISVCSQSLRHTFYPHIK